MSKYANKPTAATASKMARVPNTLNLAGAPAHAMSEKMALTTLVLTSFLKDQFYRTEAQTVAEIDRLLPLAGAPFAAKLAIFARREYGMRSVSHYIAARLAGSLNKVQWTRKFYRQVIRRPDDVLEILACFKHLYPGVMVPNSLRRGLADRLKTLSPHALAKYRKDGSELSMIDAVNICHPVANDQLSALMKGTLANAETWEVKLTQAGQQADGDAEELKDAVWHELLGSGKLGYFALLRNLRNIAEQAPNAIGLACKALVNKEAIEKSLVLPFRFVTAYEAIDKSTITPLNKRLLVEAITDAVDLSLANVPTFKGRTLVALDCSGSMSHLRMKAGLFAAVLAKKPGTDILLFDDRAKYVTVNSRVPTLTVAMQLPFPGGSTNFDCIFQQAALQGAKYDRIVILSDMQAWIGGHTPAREFAAYKRITGARPKIFCFDFAGYGSLQFPEQDVYQMAGFSEKVFDTMSVLEADREALVHEVERWDFNHEEEQNQTSEG